MNMCENMQYVTRLDVLRRRKLKHGRREKPRWGWDCYFRLVGREGFSAGGHRSRDRKEVRA